MRSIVRAVHVVLGALVAASVFVAPEAAALPTLGQPVVVGPAPTVLCTAPTLAQCTSNVAYRSDPCFAKSSTQTKCQQLVAAAGASATAATSASDELVVVPTGMTGAGTLRQTHRLPFDEARIGTGTLGTAVGFDAQQLPSLLTVRRSAPAVVSQRLAAARAVPPQQTAFEKNGPVVGSCQEFAYEKYYDLSRFEEAAGACRDDADCVAALAFDGRAPGLDMTSLRSKSGVAFATQLRRTVPATTRPKNAFFGVDPAFLSSMPEFATDAAFRAKANAIIAARAAATPYTITDAWAFHRQRQAAAAANRVLSNGEREDIARRLAQIVAAAEHLDQTNGWIARIDAVAQNPGNAVVDQRCLTVSCSLRPTWAPGAEREAAVALQAEARSRVAALLFAEWDHTSPANGQPDRGCLLGSTDRCDWNPVEVRRLVTKTYGAMRAADFNRCINATGDNFTPAVVNPSELASAEALDAALPAIAARNLALVNSLPREGANPRGVGSNGVDGGALIGSASPSESKTVGDPAYFSVSYRHGSRWSVGTRTSSNRVCGLDGERNASFHVDAQVLSSKPFEVIDVFDEVRVGRPVLADRVNNATVPAADAHRHVKLHSNLRVVGSDVYDPVDVSGLGPQQASASYQKTLASVGFQSTFFIAFIPITVGAKVEALAGIDGHLTATPPTSPCASNGSTPSIDLTGSIRPWVRADASAWIGVDIFFASAGITGKLNLITLAVPVNGGIHVQGNGQGASLVLDANAALDVQALSGGIYGYVDLFGARIVEEPIFTWDGLRWTKPLYALNSTIPLTTVGTIR